MTNPLNRSNFAYYIFHPNSKDLSSKDRKLAWAATLIMSLSLGIGHLICGCIYYAKKLGRNIPNGATKVDLVSQKHLGSQKTTTNKPASAFDAYSIARQFETLGDLAKALEYYTKAAELGDYPSFCYVKTHGSQEEKARVEPIFNQKYGEELDQLIKEFTEEPSGYNADCIARHYENLGNREEALKFHTKSTELTNAFSLHYVKNFEEPTSAYDAYFIARRFETLGDLAKALEYYTKAAELGDYQSFCYLKTHGTQEEKARVEPIFNQKYGEELDKLIKEFIEEPSADRAHYIALLFKNLGNQAKTLEYHIEAAKLGDASSFIYVKNYGSQEEKASVEYSYQEYCTKALNIAIKAFESSNC